MSIDKTLEWFQQAIPEPTEEHKCIQIGCHIEEFHEMMWAMSMRFTELQEIEESFKKCNQMAMADSKYANKQELLDSLVDQIVTAIGVAHMFGFDIQGALEEVNRSNFSKFEDGNPVFDANGKITKGKHYTPPNLKPFI